jgi:hypothetical protein
MSYILEDSIDGDMSNPSKQSVRDFGKSKVEKEDRESVVATENKRKSRSKPNKTNKQKKSYHKLYNTTRITGAENRGNHSHLDFSFSSM